MSGLEMEVQELRRDVAELKKILSTRLLTTQWVKQDVACELLNVQPQMLTRIRYRVDKKTGCKVGHIAWRKSLGKNVTYYLPDIEKYNSAFTIK